MLKLTVASIKMLYRDKQALFWAMAFPVIFTVVFGLFDFSQEPEVDIAVVRSADNAVSREIVAGLREFESFTVVTSSDLEGHRRALDDGRVGVVIAVPEMAGTGASSGPFRPGSEQAPPAPETVRVFYNQSNFDSNQFALGTIHRMVDGMNLRLAGVSTPPLLVQEEAVVGRSVEYYDFLLPGLVAMGVMTFSIIGMSVAITRFREQQILRRILATPLRPLKFLSAQVLARLVLALVQAALILAVGVYLFGANVYGNVVWLFVLVTLANLIFLNIGFAVAGRASNPDAAQGIGNAVALPMMFLSGVFFPTDTLPQVMQTVVRFLPLTPLIEAMRKVSIEGLSITDTGPQVLQLGIWVVVSFVVASRMFRFARV